MSKPLVLTIMETAKILKCQRQKVYQLLNKEILQGFKIGSDWRVKISSVEKLLGEKINHD